MRNKGLYRMRASITFSLPEKCLFMLLPIVNGLPVLLKVIHASHTLLVLPSQSDPSKLSGEACWDKEESRGGGGGGKKV